MKTLAVIVTYFPDDANIENIKAIAAQVDQVLVSDNTPEQVEKFESLKGSNIKVVMNKQNKGIAFALNQGLKLARHQVVDYLFTFDQDSLITEGYTKRLIEIGQVFYEDRGIYPTLIGPTYRHPTEEVDYQSPESNDGDYREATVLMSSGNCLRMASLPEGCTFDDDLFIDYVDFDFCFDLMQQGKLIIQANKVELIHSLGNLTTHHILGKTLQTSNHNYQRRYYITRNRRVVWNRYKESQKEWIQLDKKMELIEWLKIIFLEKEKIKKCQSIILGKRDAKNGKLGVYSHQK
ncbi:glycosyltransferase [Vagococcus sp. BWB3-3]|uniref:Glycosyltransferase n=1 Tax=Vagococcus allomyrinae TaxID=2794353 RepID=A0A940PF13_9ENTE|nr:glycosyltransferase [Vagococcus allomyrinae]MBP1043674.1 glycosyltransferase [Vagococcus allomyrinae]